MFSGGGAGNGHCSRLELVGIKVGGHRVVFRGGGNGNGHCWHQVGLGMGTVGVREWALLASGNVHYWLQGMSTVGVRGWALLGQELAGIVAAAGASGGYVAAG